MNERYFREPYHFIQPYRSTFWCRLVKPLIPARLRKESKVERWHFDGLEYLRQSFQEEAGILLTPNHSRFADAPVLGMLGFEVQRYFYYLTSYHQFKRSAWDRWLLNRIGGFSIFREGSDRDAIRECARILTEAERAVVLFPEGTWFRQNDRLGPLQEGLGVIVRQAAQRSQRPIKIHPIAVKYWYLQDPRPAIEKRLTQLELQLHWQPQQDLPLLTRLEKLGSALLAIKEIEFLGTPGIGSLPSRISTLLERIVTLVETDHRESTGNGLPIQRIRAVRQLLVRHLQDPDRPAQEIALIRRDLDRLLFAENLNSHSLQYLYERPSFERLGEAILRLEETIHDTEQPLALLGVVVRVGPPLLARDYLDKRRQREGGDPLVQDLAKVMQSMLDDLLREGPPAAWHCPAADPALLSTVSIALADHQSANSMHKESIPS